MQKSVASESRSLVEPPTQPRENGQPRLALHHLSVDTRFNNLRETIRRWFSGALASITLETLVVLSVNDHACLTGIAGKFGAMVEIERLTDI